MKKAVKLLCLALAFIMLSGCTTINDFISDDLPRMIYKISSAIDGTIIRLEQTEVEITEERFDISSYSKLTGAQQKIYRILLTVADQMPKGWVDLGECKKDYNTDITLAYRALLNDRPEIFWMPSTHLISNIGTENEPEVLIAFDHTADDSSCSYTVSKAERDKMASELEKKAQSIADEAQKKGTLFDTELYIHDTICETVTYFDKGDELIYTAYGALIDGKAVCSGYSRAFQLICDKIGLPCVPVYGKSKDEAHMWNQVNLGSGWCNIDVTWDDTEELLHNYFNVTDKDILTDHIIWELYDTETRAPISEKEEYNLLRFDCHTTADGYYERLKLVLDGNYDAAAQAIKKANAEGKKSLQLKITDSGVLKAFEKDFNVPCAKLQMRLDVIGGGVTLESVGQIGDIVTFYW